MQTPNHQPLPQHTVPLFQLFSSFFTSHMDAAT
jgi:hypothetical protein